MGLFYNAMQHCCNSCHHFFFGFFCPYSFRASNLTVVKMHNARKNLEITFSRLATHNKVHEGKTSG